MNKNYKFQIEIEKYLYDSYSELCVQYGIDEKEYPLEIVDVKGEFAITYSNLYKFDCKTAQDLAERYVSDNTFDGTLMYNKLFCTLKDGTIVQRIIVPRYRLIEYLFNNINIDPIFIKGHLRQSLQHEIGHMLSNIEILSQENGHDILVEDNKKQIEMWNAYIKDHDFDTLDDGGLIEYYTYYNNLPMEKKANEKVGLDAMAMAITDITLMRMSDIEEDEPEETETND